MTNDDTVGRWMRDWRFLAGVITLSCTVAVTFFKVDATASEQVKVIKKVESNKESINGIKTDIILIKDDVGDIEKKVDENGEALKRIEKSLLNLRMKE